MMKKNKNLSENLENKQKKMRIKRVNNACNL